MIYQLDEILTIMLKYNLVTLQGQSYHTKNYNLFLSGHFLVVSSA